MTKKFDKYIINVDYDSETGEEHTDVLKTDGTQNMENWEPLVVTMYMHHSIFENLVVELNKLYEEKEQLAEEIKELKEKIEFAGLLANHRGEMVCFANALIQDLDDEASQEMWESFKDEMYKEWKQKRGIE